MFEKCPITFGDFPEEKDVTYVDFLYGILLYIVS